MKTDGEISGVICVDKPAGITSHDVVNRMRRLYGTRKVGHAGTLDPMATGALVILIGRAAKAAEYITAWDKEYLAELQLGVETDTGDITGTVRCRHEGALPDSNTVCAAAARFVGGIVQIPPMYSALKVNGKKLVDLARQGIEVERQERTVNISKLECETIDEPSGRYRLRVVCSKGTYIRTLCEDIGRALGCCGTMAALRRIRTGNFTVSSEITLPYLENLSQAEREALLVPPEDLFSDFPRVTLPSFYAKLSRSGCEIYQKKIAVAYAVGTRVTLWDADGFYAIGEVREYPDGTAIRTVKQFRIDGSV